MTSERHERVGSLLRDHGPLAPPALRKRVEDELSRPREAQKWRGPFVARLALAGAVAASLVTLALLWPSIIGGGETDVSDVHALSGSGPTEPPPSRQDGELLAADVEGVTFPNWGPEFGWREVGQRSDELDGRSTSTLFYEHEGHVVGYTIVPGAPLDPPDDAKTRTVDGLELAVSRDDHGHDIVAFERDGKTCVLSGHVEHRSTLVELASWRGDGEVTF
jgi:hypothetical protein